MYSMLCTTINQNPNPSSSVVHEPIPTAAHLMVPVPLRLLCHLFHVLHGNLLKLPLLSICLPLLQLPFCFYMAHPTTTKISACVKVVCDLAIPTLAAKQCSKSTLASTQAEEKVHCAVAANPAV
jgi:hypothetical protein